VEEGDDLLVLDSPGAAAEYELRPLPGRERELRLFVPTLPGEVQLAHGGRVLADGVEVALLEPVLGGERGGIRAIGLRTRFPAGAKRLCVENRREEGGAATPLKIGWIEVRAPSVHSAGDILLDRAGSETTATDGARPEPGGTGLRLGQESARVTYDLSPTGIGSRELHLFVTVLGRGAATIQGGTLFVDGRPVGRLGPLRPPGRDSGEGGELRGIRCRVDLDRPPRELRIENRIGRDGTPTQLQIQRVQVRLPEEPFSSWAALKRRAAARWRAMLRRPIRLDR
jgi:hypothetical protein